MANLILDFEVFLKVAPYDDVINTKYGKKTGRGAFFSWPTKCIVIYIQNEKF